MQPATPLVADVSRYKLKRLAHWIRDDLDILIAREGPDALRSDDVLTLHELFVALRHTTTITAMDLRASGIHKAVKDVAGIATRWPGRLCDECDKIIPMWTSKFGGLDELHPFLFGRGGRLEGIASVSEYTREALLKRWAEYCPEKIHPKVSHRLGTLGFKAGDWWINPLFAHHAGIIGLESIEGGTTYDKNGAYALVLKDTGEVDARSEEYFTYRFSLNDKGKFRLTAATPASREPIRVLRSHSINSIWGPRAGIRFEGLYSVTGWSVHQAKPKDTIGGEWKEGDMLYEVILVRRDPVPMEEVSRRPTNMEVDDYAEYKRLRKLYRENKRKGHEPQQNHPTRAAPPISPLKLPGSPNIAPRSLLRLPSGTSRETTFTGPAFDMPSTAREPGALQTPDVVSPMTIPAPQDSFFDLNNKNTLTMSAQHGKKNPNSDTSSHTSPETHEQYMGPSASSFVSSVQSARSNLKDIVPWIDMEAELELPSPSDAPPVVKEQIISQALGMKAAEMNPVKNIRQLARDRGRPSLSLPRKDRDREKSIETNALNLELHSVNPEMAKNNAKETEKKREKKPTFGRKARFLDGSEYSADEEENGFEIGMQPVRVDSLDLVHSPPSRNRCMRSTSADGIPRLHAPVPMRHSQPHTLLDFGRSDSAYAPIPFSDKIDCGIEHVEFAPHSLVNLLEMVTPISSSTTLSANRYAKGIVTNEDSVAMGKLRRMICGTHYGAT